MSPKPIVIAHRGASGYLPEHTLAAYSLAAGQGADVLEPDVVLTRDHEAICLHDIHLERVTDVGERFPDRRREDGRYYALDFDLAEIRTLFATGGLRHGISGLRVPTLAEMLRLTHHLEQRLERPVGVAPELKDPAFHAAAEAPLERVVVDLLKDHGYADEDSFALIQCFDAGTLRRLGQAIAAPLVQLVPNAALDDGQLAEIATYAKVLSPPKALIEDGQGALVQRAQGAGLRVIPYTFKDDEGETARFFHEYGVDGLFSDFPDVAVRARDQR